MRIQRGFAAIVAVFMLVVLGGLGVVLAAVFSGQQKTSAYDALGIRAYQAANAGIENFAQQTIAANNCVAGNVAMGGFVATVACVQTAHQEGNTNINVFRLTSTACNRPDGNGNCPGIAGEGYIERELRATLN